MKQLLASMFLIIFSFQVLPVKELGKLLAKNTLTEEVQEDAPSNTDLKGKKDFTSFEREEKNEISSFLLSSRIAIVIHNSECLPDYHVADILTPPPNA